MIREVSRPAEWRKLLSMLCVLPFENCEGWGNLSCESRKAANQPSGLQIQHPGMPRMGYYYCRRSRCPKNETLSEKAEKAGRESLG